MNGDKLVDKAEKLKTRADFLSFLKCLIENYESYPDDWENNNLFEFLEGLAGFAESADGYYMNIGLKDFDVEKPSWRGFADMLLAAKVYE